MDLALNLNQDEDEESPEQKYIKRYDKKQSDEDKMNRISSISDVYKFLVLENIGVISSYHKMTGGGNPNCQ